jgi:hypothetical protein
LKPPTGLSAIRQRKVREERERTRGPVVVDFVEDKKRRLDISCAQERDKIVVVVVPGCYGRGGKTTSKVFLSVVLSHRKKNYWFSKTIGIKNRSDFLLSVVLSDQLKNKYFSYRLLNTILKKLEFIFYFS